MKKIFWTAINNNSVHTWLLFARLAVGAIMLTHGIPKLQNLLANNIQFSDPIGIGATPSFVLVVFAEVVCSILLMLGFAGRLASLVLIIDMAVAATIAHAGQPFGKKELSLLYLVFFIGFLILGPGKYAVDSLIGPKARRGIS